jgi:myo-inositol-1(or 4)-monophosphatase
MILPENLNAKIEPIIREAGNILLSYFNTDVKKIDKGTSYATQADIESENFLKQRLTEVISNASFWAEESGKSGTGDYCWVIDPLDGTTNFAQGLPYFCVSIALTYLEEPVFGVIFDPIHNEYFYAQKNEGAYLNNKKISVSTKQKLSDAFLVVSFPYGIKPTYEKNWHIIQNVGRQCFTMRITGAAALDLANVASGRFDGSFFYRLKWWDIAAGWLLIKEAGGISTDFDLNEITPEFKSFICANIDLHRQLINIFQLANEQ